MIPLLVWYGIEPLVGADPAKGIALANASQMDKVTGFIYRRLSAEPAGREALLDALRAGRGGLRANDFGREPLATWIGRVAGVEDTALPASLSNYHSRNNRLAWLGMQQDGFREHSDGESVRGSMNVGYRLSENMETRFYINANSVDQRIPGSVTREAALTDPKTAAANNIAGDYYQERQRIVSAEAQRIARALGDADLSDAGRSALGRQIDADVRQGRISLVEVFRVDRPAGEAPAVVATARIAGPAVPEASAPGSADRLAAGAAADGAEAHAIDQLPNGGELIRTAVPIRASARGPVRGVVIASEYLTSQFAARARRMTGALIIVAAALTALLSGIFGMAGGLLLMGALALLLPVSAAFVTHGILQLVSNGWRAIVHREHVVWRVLGAYALAAAMAGGLVASIAFTPGR